MRVVHDIIVASAAPQNGQRSVLAFIQHGTKAEGYIYENVCPWCEATVEKVTAHSEAKVIDVLTRLQKGLAGHLHKCPRRGSTRLSVIRTTQPLNTEKLVREM